MHTHLNYKLLAQQAAEVVDFFTDLCGGQLMLAIYAELLNEFIVQGKLSSAQLLVKKLDEVFEYVEAVEHAPLLHASGLQEEFHLLADSAARCWPDGNRETIREISLSPGSGTTGAPESAMVIPPRRISKAPKRTSASDPA